MEERFRGHYSTKINRILAKINRTRGWLMLIFMIIFLISGYALTKHIIMQMALARYQHITLDIYMTPVFLAHVLINTKFTQRWVFHHDEVINLVLVLVGMSHISWCS